MNEIKFRVWDINEEEYCDKYYHNGFLIATDGTLIMYDSRTRKYLGVNGDYIIELYTGLKDKKGVEIYENDNIKDDYSNEVATVISGKIGYDGVWNGLTGFVLDIWASDYDDEKYYELWHGFNPSNIEVVGTIHDKK